MSRAYPLHKRNGFTLVEIMIVVAIIGLLAAIAIPSFMKARERSQITSVANDFRVFEAAFAQYALDYGNYPPDTHVVLPSRMDEYIDNSDWLGTTPVGGDYNWEGPDNYPYAGISLYDSDATAEQATKLDAVLDDGDLSTGSFRLTANGRYTYIIKE